MTYLGKIASSIAEIHPLILSRRLVETRFFQNLNVYQLIGLFSCFTDIKIADDLRCRFPSCEDTVLKNEIIKLVELSNHYEDKESELNTNTGIHYHNLLMFDMIDYSMQWCHCNTEEQCKFFIQFVISDKGFSIGDYTKGMMKIVTISRELENICEIFQEFELLHKLKQIDGLILKYVLTSQSLYI